ncbi:sulfite oxidase heme-binding subunit YedZ [Marichromatium gracile]|uniref:Protein-methionine-sulfoxide reductase heme-binding subunit MsrQ n=1 Tax=Marichromatium gracile TaxID=1048 RepID=A0A4R4ABK2_MARGR|nr:protein-methionine-sulfoxide reductase heme-binding subunit MsrQ [Marichromatium gracile]MBK1709183.1 sulfoxide reductase heme-binding subunit YedZ [Marichromatium gracile]TCW35976.1 sulfoxide reductase heme-binding subunit YedZ [Marichromatium gracile]
MTGRDWVAWAKPGVFLLCLLPLALTLAQGLGGGLALGANPVETLLHRSGLWTLRMLLLTLALTPLSRALGRPWPIRLRRMLGLFAFFYGMLHLLVYLWLDRALDWPVIVEDLTERPYIIVGMVALVLMSVLALTSTRGWQRRLRRNWKRLHRVVYLIAVLGVLHFLWLVKADLREPLIYAVILGVLLALRLPWGRWRRAWTQSAQSAPAVARRSASSSR